MDRSTAPHSDDRWSATAALGDVGAALAFGPPGRRGVPRLEILDHLARALDVELVAAGPQLGEQFDQLLALVGREPDLLIDARVQIARRVARDLASPSGDDSERRPRVSR